jgi:hypothetical protein
MRISRSTRSARGSTCRPATASIRQIDGASLGLEPASFDLDLHSRPHGSWLVSRPSSERSVKEPSPLLALMLSR